MVCLLGYGIKLLLSGTDTTPSAPVVRPLPPVGTASSPPGGDTPVKSPVARPSDPTALSYWKQADTERVADHWKAAIRAYEQAIQRYPEDNTLNKKQQLASHRDLANCLMALQRFDEAQKELDIALNLDSFDDGTHFARMFCFSSKNNVQAALQECTWIEINSTDNDLKKLVRETRSNILAKAAKDPSHKH